MADTPVFISGNYAGGVVQAAWQYSGSEVSFILAVF